MPINTAIAIKPLTTDEERVVAVRERLLALGYRQVDARSSGLVSFFLYRRPDDGSNYALTVIYDEETGAVTGFSVYKEVSASTVWTDYFAAIV